ncbi:MAG: bifunctional phosphopantothenoylcysteine decarboxylase/phosphopantothenate synthase [Novosphingobium sp.]|nr:bifunctional phosphopantothenoylcysteine decarboxylase/phosphopantothenate synthase [Novosphingobium sp.]
MKAPRILLVVGGGIAAYKSCELVRLIRKGGGDVTCVLTEGGARFVTPMALAALSENPVHTTLWDLKNEVEMGHIQLSRQADLVVVCPATADLLAKMAGGIADDLATTLLLATDKPVMAVPAMNVRMWQHAATMRNVETLRMSGVFVMEPSEGAMACGEFGPGRLPEPTDVWYQIAALLGVDPGELPPQLLPAAGYELPVPATGAAAPAEIAPAETAPSETGSPETVSTETAAQEDEPGESGETADMGLGGLSASLIRRGTRKAMALFGRDPDAEAASGIPGEPPLEPPPEWEAPPSYEDMPFEAPGPDDPVPPLNLDSPLLSKKGKARSAPPTDPEAINHLVSGHEDALLPEPFPEEAGAFPSHEELSGDAPAGPPDDPLAGQPDFAQEPEHRPLYGRHVLITAGPTHEPIDPVRYIANRSSGKQGFAIAAAAAAAGARVTLVAGPVHLETPPGVDRIDVESAREMADAVKKALPADVAIMVAAVADWRTDRVAGEKIKKRGSAPPALLLTENPDILASVAASPKRPGLLVGFAAETEQVLEHAAEKRKRKGADWIVANDVSGDVMGGEVNAVHIVTSGGVESLPEMPKEDVARALMQRIADELGA